MNTNILDSINNKKKVWSFTQEEECLKDELGLIICFDLTVIIRTSRAITRTQTLSQATPFTQSCTQLQRKSVAVTAA